MGIQSKQIDKIEKKENDIDISILRLFTIV